MLTQPKSLKNLLDTMDELLFSEWSEDRHYGLNWLFDVLVVVLEEEQDKSFVSADNPLANSSESAVNFGGMGRGAVGRGRPGSPGRQGSPRDSVGRSSAIPITPVKAPEGPQQGRPLSASQEGAK